MSQTQTAKIYSDPPIKINRTLYGVLLATLASVFWGSMGVCVQYIFENTNTQPQAFVFVSAFVVRYSPGHPEFVFIPPTAAGCFVVTEGNCRHRTQRA